MSQSEFEPTKGRCGLVAQSGSSQFAAVGRPAFVAGAAIGNAIGEAVRQQAVFDNCMQASGFHILDMSSSAVNQREGTKAALREAGLARTASLRELWAQPQFAWVSAHLPPTGSDNWTLAQLGDPAMISPSERSSFSTYMDQIQTYDQAWEVSVNRTLPPFGGMIHSYSTQVQDVSLALIKGQMTWGDWSTQMRDLRAAFRVKTGSIQL